MSVEKLYVGAKNGKLTILDDNKMIVFPKGFVPQYLYEIYLKKGKN